MKNRTKILILLGISTILSTSVVSNRDPIEPDKERTIYLNRIPDSQALVVMGNWTFDSDFQDQTGSGPNIMPYYSTHINYSGGVDGNGYLNISGYNSYAEIAAYTPYDTWPLTMEFWLMSIEDTYNVQDIFYKYGHDGYTYRITRDSWTGTNTGSVRLSCHNDTGDYWGVGGSNNLTHNEWHHIVIYVDQTDIGYYINGELSNTRTVQGSITTDSTKITLGDRNRDNATMIDNLVIYSGIMTHNEVKERYALHKPIGSVQYTPFSPKEDEPITFDASAS